MRNAELDRSAFEKAASDMFGKDMSGWARITTFDRDIDTAGGVTRLVLAVDAMGNPLPAAGERPEGYTLGGIVIVSISHIGYGGVRPQVQINVWNPFNNRLLETGHSTPSMWEMDALTGGNPNWVENPEIVERVMAEFETALPDAITDALNQLAPDGRLPSAPADLWAESLGTDDKPAPDPWDGSQGFPDGPPVTEPAPDADIEPPPGVKETVPWVPDDVHETEPWDPKASPSTAAVDASPADEGIGDSGVDWDTYEAYPGENELFERLDGPREPPEESHPIDDIGGLPDEDATVDDESDVDWDSFETYRGDKEKYDRLDTEERLPPEESVPIEDIENLQEDLPPETPPTPRGTSVSWAGTTSGRTSPNSAVRAMFTDEHPPIDPATGQPVSVISGQITTSSGTSVPVQLFLMSHTPGGSAVYGSHLLSVAGEGVNHLPAVPGDSVVVSVGGRSDSIIEMHGHPLEMVHAIQKDRLFALGTLVAEMRRQYVAATEGREDDPVVAFNRDRFDESLRTIQLGIDHADDPGVLKEQVARTQYYLDHTSINSVSLRRLAEGKTMIDPYHDDIRRVTTLKHGLSMLSFYQNDVVIHEHFTTLVDDAKAYGEFMRSKAVGKHFDKIAISILQSSYDPLIDKTPMAWLYPILSYAATGTFTDHHGKDMTPGAVAALGIEVILKALDFSRSQLSKTGRYTPGRGEMDYGEAALLHEITEEVTEKGMDGAVTLAGTGVGALIDHQYAQADAAARGTDSTPAPPPTAAPTAAGVKKLSTGVKVGIGAVAAVVVIGGGAYIVGNSGGDTTASETTTTSQPAVVVQEDPAPEATGGDTADDEAADPGIGDPPPQLDEGAGVEDDELFEIPVPERDPGSLDAETYDGPSAQEILLLPAPDPTTSDDEQRKGGGSLYVDATYVVDWQADIVTSNGVITPGYLFPPGSGWTGEYLILADCTGNTCVFSTPLAHGDTMVFTQAGQTIYGTSNDTSGRCNRDIFIAFRVSDYQTINGRLVPDAIHGARIETGECETPVYREIVYEGGFEFVGSYNDQ